jgi:hypothetical protein
MYESCHVRIGGAGLSRRNLVKVADESSRIVSKRRRVCLLLSFVSNCAILFPVLVSVTSCKNVLRDSFFFHL